MTFYLGLLLTKDLPDMFVSFKGDNLLIVKLLNDRGSHPPSEISNIIVDCHSILSQYPLVTISYVHRDCNNAVHAIAAMASKEHVSHKWNGTNIR